MRRWVLAAVLGVTPLAACAGDIRPDDFREDPDPGTGLDGGPVGKVRVVDNGNGTSSLTVDARDMEGWVYIDLAALDLREPADPATSSDWDLGLQRFHYALDGGVSGTGQGALVVMDGAALADVSEAPADGWVTDQPDDAVDEDALPEYAFETAEGGWYDYDDQSHVLTPKERVYVILGADGTPFAVQIDAYYDDAGSPGWPSFTVKPL